MNEYKKNDGDIEDVDVIERKKEDKPPIYDWTLLHESLESEDDKLIPFLNMLEKLINPNDRNLAEQTITQQQKCLSFLSYFLAGVGNKQISAIRKDIAMFLDQSGTSNQAIDTFSSIQLSSSSRENRHEKNLSNYQDNAINANVDDYHNIHGLQMPTTTFTSDVYHMTTILAIPIPETRAVPNDAIHNLLLIDYDLFDSLVSYCYDAEIHEEKEEQQLKNTLLIDFIHLELKSTQSYIEAMKAIVMQQHPSQKDIIPEFVRSFIPIMGPLHVSLNSHDRKFL
ncbi:4322_t:CDS:2 [Entrophospora sp. SA101]|nr:4322_t:CDS:2 [Entrophospora sp. SA101]